MAENWTPTEKDQLLAEMFDVLKARDISSDWTTAPNPYTQLRGECQSLMADTTFRKELADYLRVRSIIPRSLKMFITYYSMAANADWTSVSDDVKPLAARGWFLGRWMATFLIIDGPVGRFVCGNDSPLHSRLGSSYPILTAARDFLSERVFKLLRNGFAHWGFDWEVVGNDSYVIAYDWERDLQTAKLHQKEADAFHLAAFALVEILDDVFVSHRSVNEKAG